MFFFLGVVLFLFLGFENFYCYIGFVLFFEKELKVDWVGTGKKAEGHGREESHRIYLNFKMILNNKYFKGASGITVLC